MAVYMQRLSYQHLEFQTKIRIMPYADQVISAPVGIYDIQQCFGIANTDIGNLIANANINKWAKYKPIRHPSVDTVTGQWDFTNDVWLAAATWWKANGMCGMTTEVATEFGDPTNSTSFAYKLINGLLGWSYVRPVVGYPFRFADFAQYYHAAIAPYGELGSTQLYINNNNEATLAWDVVEVDPKNLSLTDFAVAINGTTYQLTDFYLGIILYRSGGSYCMFTSANKFGGGDLSITIDASGSQMPGDWLMMPFFTLEQVNSQGTFDAPGGFISMADTTPVTVTLTTNGSNYIDEPYGMWNNQAGTEVYYEVDLVNDTSSSHTYDTIRISIIGGSPTGTELAHVDISNTSVQGHTTETITGTITATKAGYSSYWIVVTDLTSGTTIRSRYNQIEDYDGPVD